MMAPAHRARRGRARHPREPDEQAEVVSNAATDGARASSGNGERLIQTVLTLEAVRDIKLLRPMLQRA